MSISMAEAIERRFGDGGPSGDGIVENDFIRRILSRKTVRRFNDVVPSESLIDLLVAAALSASAGRKIKRGRPPRPRAGHSRSICALTDLASSEAI
jgi:hypothetical protein